jgi:hypothetical protein
MPNFFTQHRKSAIAAAAVIAFIDPGRAKNKDCVASLSYANESIHN